MSDIAIPDSEVQIDQAPVNPSLHSTTEPNLSAKTNMADKVHMGEIPDNEVELDTDKYSSLGQQTIAGLEGIGKGIAGPLAPLLERGLGVKPEDIRGRAEENPITAGVGETAGLGVGLLTGTGEAAVMTKAGEAATELAGLANLGK